MMRYGVGYGAVKAIFISHMHLDHFLGIFGLIETIRMNTERESLIIFAPRGLAHILEAMSPTMNWNRSFLDLREIQEGELYRGRDYSISAFRVEHMGKPSFGFVFKEDDKNKFNEKKAKGLGLQGKLFREIQEKGFVEVGGKKVKLEEVSWMRKGMKVVYSGDTGFDERIAGFAHDADLLIHEATFGEDLKEEAEKRGHTTAKGAARIAKKAGVERLALTHISGRYKGGKDLEKEAKEIFKNSFVVKDGDEVEIKPEKEEK